MARYTCTIHVHIRSYALNVGFICYDDGCHLKKYASNPVRKSCTPTTERLSSLTQAKNEDYQKE